MTVSMADPSRTEFRTFLQSQLWDDRQQMPLSMLSAFARLDVDPWEAAVTLARLPSDKATIDLESMLARLPGAATCADLESLCERAVKLLPCASPQPQATTYRGGGAAATPLMRGLDGKIVLLALAMMLTSVLLSELAPRANAPSTAAHGASDRSAQRTLATPFAPAAPVD